MIDDPLSLLAVGIWLMAAGMWPVGFLFGACSKCCDECPEECSKCTHYYHLAVDPPNPDYLEFPCFEKFDSVTLSAECDTCSGAISIPNVYPDNNNFPEPQNGDVFLTDEISCGQGEGETPFTARLSANNIQLFYPDAGFSPCGCPVCDFILRVQLEISFPADFGGNFELNPFLEIRGTFDRCQQTQSESTLTAFSKEILNDVLSGFALENSCDIQSHLFDDDVVLKMTLEMDFPCECGACCKDGDCRDNVSQDFCEDQDNAFFTDPDSGGGVWQGVGTACDDDPDPCAEE
jgi:hypothetical protein